MRQAEIERTIGDIKPFGHFKDSGCPKCKTPSQGFACRWCSGKSALEPASVRQEPGKCGLNIVGEHLHFMCGCCQYGWVERTADMAPVPGAPETNGVVEAGPASHE
jgi:hypothetical protein